MYVHVGGGSGSRVAHIQNIRARLQQQHKERNGVYPLDDEQDRIEQRIQQVEQQVAYFSLLDIFSSWIFFHADIFSMRIIIMRMYAGSHRVARPVAKTTGAILFAEGIFH